MHRGELERHRAAGRHPRGLTRRPERGLDEQVRRLKSEGEGNSDEVRRQRDARRARAEGFQVGLIQTDQRAGGKR